MIKLIIFDFDGVLVKAKKIHFQALNEALTQVEKNLCKKGQFVLSWDEHLSIYDGLKTTQKLKLISENKGLPQSYHEEIWKIKQETTQKLLNNIACSPNINNCLDFLFQSGYKLALCSNSIRKTISLVLDNFKINQYFNYILSNEDVKNSKPHPEIYWKTMSFFDVLPNETLIIEDSPQGLKSAYYSGAHVLRVKSPDDVTFFNLINKIRSIDNFEKMKWQDSNLNVLIPMAGAGSRFEKAGYSFPKPLIDINNKPMIQLVVEALGIQANYIYIVQSKHREKYNLDSLLNLITPNCKIISVDGLTEGAACTALLAKDFINNNQPLFFANSDQYVDWDSSEFMYKMQETDAEGGIVTFKSTHPKWSFVKLNQFGFVTEVAEKNPISDNATIGYYYWKNGSDFVKYAEQMINNNTRVNNEFYVCPVFNEAIRDNKRILTFEVDAKNMWGLGTPEDLKYFLENYKQNS